MECVICRQFACVSEIYACGHYTCFSCGSHQCCPIDSYPPASANPSIAPYFAYLRELVYSQTDYYECLSLILAAVQSTYSKLICPNCRSTLSNSMEVCTVCTQFAFLPSLRLGPSAMESCLCPKCNMQFSTVRCEGCGYMNLACAKTLRWDKPARAAESIAPVANPCWQCQNCRYEYNMQAQCLQCGNSQAAVPVYPSLPAVQQSIPSEPQYSYSLQPDTSQHYAYSLPVAKTQSQGVVTWQCLCGQNNPAFQARCKCGVVPTATLPQSASIGHPPTQSMCWTCLRCEYGYNLNYQLKCTHCNSPKPNT